MPMENKGKAQTIVPPDWAGLANLSHTVNQLSEAQCVKDLQNLFAHIDNLKSKVSQQQRNDQSQRRGRQSRR